MKILVTSPYVIWPANFGGAVRTLNVVHALTDLGHEVILLTASPAGSGEDVGVNVDWRGYESGSGLSHFYNPRFVSAFRNALSEQPDLVLVEFPYQARMIIGAARQAGVPIVYDAHNVEADRFRKMRKPLISRVVQLMESYCCRHAANVLVTSESDSKLLRRYYEAPSLVMPNGVDTSVFVPDEPDKQLQTRLGISGNKVALFFGTLSYGPNAEALEFLVKKVWPKVIDEMPDTRLLVVGRNAPDWVRGGTGIIATGAVDDIAAHIRLADIVLAPLFSGGGTRLKIVEALACGQTVLSTPFGAEGLSAESNGALILAEEDEFATRLVALLQQDTPPGQNKEARQMALVYDWRKIISSIDWEGFAQTSQ